MLAKRDKRRERAFKSSLVASFNCFDGIDILRKQHDTTYGATIILS